MEILYNTHGNVPPNNRHKLITIERLNRSKTKGIKVGMVMKFLNVNFGRTEQEIELAVNAIKGTHHPARTMLN